MQHFPETDHLRCTLIDAEKAFDKVWHDGLFTKVDQASTDSAHVDLIKSLYENLESQVLWKGKATDPIPILQGVRQGSVLSPLLYSVFVDGLIKTLREKDLGCHLHNQYAGAIVLADDVALISTSPDELQEMLIVTYEYAQMWRYRINPSKSCILVFNERGKTTTQQRTWMLGDEPVRQARQHPHLGIIKSPSPYDPTDHMITRGTHAFYALTGAGAYTGGLLPHHSSRDLDDSRSPRSSRLMTFDLGVDPHHL